MTSNIRILASDKAATALISASSTAGAMVASNMQNDIKSQVWRAAGTGATLTLTWANFISVDTVVLPFTNFSNGASILINAYTNTGDTAPVWTMSGNACPYSSPSVFGWDVLPPSSNFFGYGSAVYCAFYSNVLASIKKLEIAISDNGNTNGFIEIGRLLCGARFEPDRPTEYGLSLTFDDRSTNKRNGAGDLISELKTRSKRLSFDTAFETDGDRKMFQGIMRQCGTSKPLFIDAKYSESDYDTRQNYMIYGKFSKASTVVHKFVSNYQTSVEIEEV